MSGVKGKVRVESCQHTNSVSWHWMEAQKGCVKKQNKNKLVFSNLEIERMRKPEVSAAEIKESGPGR